jgi:hypothetical protein
MSGEVTCRLLVYACLPACLNATGRASEGGGSLDSSMEI